MVGGLVVAAVPFGPEESKATSVAAVVGSTKVGQTEQRTQMYI